MDIFRITKVAKLLLRDGKISKVYVSGAPGRLCKQGQRNLEDDMRTIMCKNIDVILCLLEWSEFDKLNLLDYPSFVQKRGILFYHFPIPDMSIPQSLMETNNMVKFVNRETKNGRKILIHCRAGMGRSPLIAACCIGKLTLYDCDKLLSLIRKNIRGAISLHQEEFLLKFINSLQRVIEVYENYTVSYTEEIMSKAIVVDDKDDTELEKEINWSILPSQMWKLRTVKSDSENIDECVTKHSSEEGHSPSSLPINNIDHTTCPKYSLFKELLLVRKHTKEDNSLSDKKNVVHTSLLQ